MMFVLVAAIACTHCLAYVPRKPIPSAVTETTTARIHVNGMGCERCSARLREGLTKLDGVIAVEVSLEKKELAITFDPRRTTVERLKAEIARYGFDAS